jgi:hypothetical protein
MAGDKADSGADPVFGELESEIAGFFERVGTPACAFCGAQQWTPLPDGNAGATAHRFSIRALICDECGWMMLASEPAGPARR